MNRLIFLPLLMALPSCNQHAASDPGIQPVDQVEAKQFSSSDTGAMNPQSIQEDPPVDPQRKAEYQPETENEQETIEQREKDSDQTVVESRYSEPEQRDELIEVQKKVPLRMVMPGKSFRGELPELTPQQVEKRDRMKIDLEKLAGEIGERNLRQPQEYALAGQWIEKNMAAAGYQVAQQIFQVKGRNCVNFEAEISGRDKAAEIIVVGAHYDSARGTPGANDNGSGVVALLELARSMSKERPARTLRFVFFANEEPPYFQTANMGSLVYARRCHDRQEKIIGMLSLETMGYFSDEENSQNYPPPFSLVYPSTGNFIGFVGDSQSGDFVAHCVEKFRDSVEFPSEGAAAPAWIEGIGWSDHWSFWQFGYPALMVTDTAPFRYDHYHLPSDTPDKVSFSHMARVVTGLEAVINDLANPTQDNAKKDDAKKDDVKKTAVFSKLKKLK